MYRQKDHRSREPEWWKTLCSVAWCLRWIVSHVAYRLLQKRIVLSLWQEFLSLHNYLIVTYVLLPAASTSSGPTSSKLFGFYSFLLPTGLSTARHRKVLRPAGKVPGSLKSLFPMQNVRALWAGLSEALEAPHSYWRLAIPVVWTLSPVGTYPVRRLQFIAAVHYCQVQRMDISEVNAAVILTTFPEPKWPSARIEYQREWREQRRP